MKRITQRAVLPLLALLFAVACGGDPSEPVVGTAVMVKDNEFKPMNLQVTAGQVVTWTWDGNQPHTVTFDVGGTNSSQQTDGTFQRQFPAAGIYSYHCVVHGTSMSGMITVQ